MRKVCCYLIPIAVICFSCKKEQVTSASPLKQEVPVLTTAVKKDTIPDGSGFKLSLQKDSTPVDETSIIFRHAAITTFDASQDARYFQGFGTGSLGSFTTDSVLCAIQTMPYSAGTAIRLNAEFKNSGTYLLKLSFVKSLSGVEIWLHDHMKKDSVNLITNNYAFEVNTADTSSYGGHRFEVVLK